ncbi:MAG: hypothetical protein J7K57_06565 [Palaeococcus sp.]|uniref:hypothetical protein n=1 Tax=Palaeococcus sp. (in: euryarchaeotes) TaxID=2820298 RepID=UPI0025FAB1AA|nr:hypothetical protein [Palaeococcus sp. (in: euryarchaeotes)]MCD6559518.1 hypothetical protein [Palaeococcus sp. (in: euryarchaeotes)]
MQENRKAFTFLLFTTPLWALSMVCINELAQHYPKIVDMLPGFRVWYDLYSGRYLVSDSYGFIYPLLFLALLTTIFLRNTKVPLVEFAVLSILVPFIVLFIATIIGTLTPPPSAYRDDEVVTFFAFYVMPVTSFISGVTFYYLLSRITSGVYKMSG